ncbi:MAG: hypothetical protein OES47_15350 [Acidobacteriota bacterium]|nr:hypothetical protein [Acidobacteriota bacterium]
MTQEWRSRFDRAFEDWARRPPPTPPDQAAARLVARLPKRRRRGVMTAGRPRLATVVAGLGLAIAIGWLISGLGTSVTDEVLPPPLDENVVVLWLDDQTPLYLTVALPATKGGL